MSREDEFKKYPDSEDSLEEQVDLDIEEEIYRKTSLEPPDPWPEPGSGGSFEGDV